MALTLLLAVGTLLLFLAGMVALIATSYRRVSPDEALVVSRPGREPTASFGSMVVVPLFHEARLVSLREHAIEIVRHGESALRTRDDRAVELVATFRIRIGKTPEDVVRASTAMGDGASDPGRLRERFAPAFDEAMESVARLLDAETFDKDRTSFKERVLEQVGTDLDGLRLEDLSVTGVRVQPGSAYRG